MSKKVASLENISKTYGKEDLTVKALDSINLEIYKGDYLAVMGASGSGKSTAMNIIGCLDRPSEGVYKLNGIPIENLSDDELAEIRNQKLGFVFQQFHLLSDATALENVTLPMIYAGIDPEQRLERGKNALKKVGLSERMNNRPNQLSGGMQQRVGLARALATNTDIMLMDEAFSALDPLIRSDMQKQLIDLQSELKKTIVFITHDLDESLRLGDHIGILNAGKLVQVGTPVEIIMNPADEYVEAFVKDVNRTKVIKAKIIMKPVNQSDDIDKSNLIKVEEDQFIEEFLPQVVCSNSNCEVVDKQGNAKGYISNKELQESLSNS